MSIKLAPATLEELIAKAESEKSWLFSPYQELWFSPEELREQNAVGNFRWSPCNWRLRKPDEHLIELTNKAKAAAQEVERFKKRLPLIGTSPD